MKLKLFLKVSFILLIIGIFASSSIPAQLIYSTNNQFSADVSVYVTDNQFSADLLVFKCDSQFSATKKQRFVVFHRQPIFCRQSHLFHRQPIFS